MVYLSDWSKQQQDVLLNQDLPKYNDTACVNGPPLSERRIAIITTSGLHQRTDRVFTPGVGEYRIIPDDTNMDDLIMSHVSTNFDRTGFYQDLNTVFPIDRLRELRLNKEIGGIASYHYSFMGATPPTAQEIVASDLADNLKSDFVNGVILAGV